MSRQRPYSRSNACRPGPWNDVASDAARKRTWSAELPKARPATGPSPAGEMSLNVSPPSSLTITRVTSAVRDGLGAGTIVARPPCGGGGGGGGGEDGRGLAGGRRDREAAPRRQVRQRRVVLLAGVARQRDDRE